MEILRHHFMFQILSIHSILFVSQVAGTHNKNSLIPILLSAINHLATSQIIYPVASGNSLS